MNIYGSLMDIYDEKHKNIYDEKTQTKKLYAPIINRNI